jgi:hypothetical protein
MDYNTTREPLVLPEYGRIMQAMVDQICEIEDREFRTKAAKSLVNVMSMMNPSQKDFSDFKRKLWDHLYIISDFKLDVDAPYPAPSMDIVKPKPGPVSYAGHYIRYRHYGKLIQDMVLKIADMEEGAERDELIFLVSNYMKASYLAWNRDTVSDDLIMGQLDDLSMGKVQLPEDMQLLDSGDLLLPKPQTQRQNNQGKKKNNKRRRK